METALVHSRARRAPPPSLRRFCCCCGACHAELVALRLVVVVARAAPRGGPGRRKTAEVAMGKWHSHHHPDGILGVQALRREFGADVFPQLGLVRSTAFRCRICGLRFRVPGVGVAARAQADVRWRRSHPLCVRGEDPVRRGAGAQRGAHSPDPPPRPRGCQRSLHRYSCRTYHCPNHSLLRFSPPLGVPLVRRRVDLTPTPTRGKA